MSKLYTDGSRNFIDYVNDSSRNLVGKLNRAEESMDMVYMIIDECTEFCALNHDSYHDTRNSWFPEDDFSKSMEMEKLARKTEEMKCCAEKLREQLARVADQVENLEFVTSGEFQKWYDEQHKYDYERA